MRVIRTPRSSAGFTQIDNDVLRDNGISNAAHGLLHRILSFPDNWRTDYRALAEMCKDGETAIRSQLKELRAAGYVEQKKYRDERGRWHTDTLVYDRPQGRDLPMVGRAPSAPVAGHQPSTEGTGPAAYPASPSNEAGHQHDPVFPQVAPSVGSPRSETQHSYEEPQEDKNKPTELNCLPSAKRGRESDTTFVDWRPEDRELFRSIVGDTLYSDGTDYNEGSFPAEAWYDTMLTRRLGKPMRWPGKYVAKLSNDNGLENYFAFYGITTDA